MRLDSMFLAVKCGGGGGATAAAAASTITSTSTSTAASAPPPPQWHPLMAVPPLCSARSQREEEARDEVGARMRRLGQLAARLDDDDDHGGEVEAGGSASDGSISSDCTDSALLP